MKEKHLYASLVTYVTHKRRFTRFQRTAALTSTLLLSMGINSLFEQASSVNPDVNSFVAVINGHTISFPVSGFYTSFLIFPASMFILFAFTYAAGHEMTIIKVKKMSKKEREEYIQQHHVNPPDYYESEGNSKSADELMDEFQKREGVPMKNLSKADQKRISKLIEPTDFKRSLSRPEKEKEASSPSDDSVATRPRSLSHVHKKIKKQNTFLRKSLAIETEKIIENEAMEVEVIPAYHEEDFINYKTPPKDWMDYVYRIYVASKTWRIAAYVLSVVVSIIGIVLPFFYAGDMTYKYQVYWIIDVIISTALGALIYQPASSAFVSFYQAYQHKDYVPKLAVEGDLEVQMSV